MIFYCKFYIGRYHHSRIKEKWYILMDKYSKACHLCKLSLQNIFQASIENNIVNICVSITQIYHLLNFWVYFFNKITHSIKLCTRVPRLFPILPSSPEIRTRMNLSLKCMCVCTSVCIIYTDYPKILSYVLFNLY